MPNRPVLLAAALLFLLPGARTQPAAGPDAIVPTVTRATGDTGGRSFGRSPDPARTRHYYVAAEPELWDFAPAGRDEMCGRDLPPPVQAARAVPKLRYIQYTDATFAARAFAPRHLGILGPVLRGVVGETLAVTFLNRTDQPLSMHPHGVRYDKDNEGAYYRPGPGRGAAVAPGATYTYVWELDADSGPRPDEPSSKAWLYHSHVAGDTEINLGLAGCIVVTDPARARPDGTPADVDRELATLFLIFDESGLGAAEKEAAEYASLPGGNAAFVKSFAQVQELMEAGARYAINGRIFGNLRGLEMNEGERVRWYVFGLGSERDFHTAHWHGARLTEDGRRRTDVIELLPATMKVADLRADNPGTWMLHCHVAEHMTEGMFAPFTVYGRNQVGVSRAPQEAFPGLQPAGESLRITRAEAVPETPGKIRLEGTVTVFEGFAVFTDSIRVQVGERSFAFKVGRAGAAEIPGARWRTTNADEFGVVRGGAMAFELTLDREVWPAAPGAAAGTPLGFSLAIGKSRHEGSVSLADR
jgi:FtsP/CotA-like multicopper oxidase with cupredoxin domain